MNTARARVASRERLGQIGALVVLSVVLLASNAAQAQQTVDVGATGFGVKRPVLASACPNGCPWGELGDFVVDAMKPLGYEVILCRNCNGPEGPRIVASASYPPELSPVDALTGTTTRVNAPVDFGVTESGFLAWAYGGRYLYAQDGPRANLRLIAKIEDPYYLLVAVKADSGITDLAQIAQRRMPVAILGGGSPTSQPVLDYYGLTADAVASWGGSLTNPLLAGANGPFDVIVSELASPANNPESAYWTTLSQKYDLRFLDLPEPLLAQMANDQLGMTRAVAKWGLLRGVDRPIATVARSGNAVFARDDTPEQAAYDAARAIDGHRSGLKWYIRPYSYDSATVWQNFDVPLHPGAERYYREMGYLPGSMRACGTDNGDGGTSQQTNAATSDAQAGGSDGCAMGTSSHRSVPVLWFGLLGLLARRRQRRAAHACWEVSGTLCTAKGGRDERNRPWKKNRTTIPPKLIKRSR
ncbi:MAG TPA: TAXI family TRAP transporter solute-binding subunit [Polyangiaceae bacterium]|nr:TAXI family TRAP transporter solute-binding subunit [Polyangiaceae bacterium]